MKNNSVSTKAREKARAFPRQQNSLPSSPWRWHSGADIYTAACSALCCNRWIFLAGIETHGESTLVLVCPKGWQPMLEQGKEQQRTVMD